MSAAFFSYAQDDDNFECGRLTKFREILSKAVVANTDLTEFPIFFDRDNIVLGQSWRTRLGRELKAAPILIVIVTPNCLKSDYCRFEISEFLKKESEIERNDLVLPIYYRDCDRLNQTIIKDALERDLMAHQAFDWRGLLYQPWEDVQVQRSIDALARQVGAAWMRINGPDGRLPLTKPNEPGQLVKAGRPLEQAGQSTPVENLVEVLNVKPEIPRIDFLTKEPPELVLVDSSGKQGHSSIGQALECAPPGARILVQPGFYRERVVIQHPVELLGDGSISDEVVIESAKEIPLIFSASMGRVSNLTIRSRLERSTTVAVAQGILRLDRCRIRGSGGTGLLIDSGANPDMINIEVLGCTTGVVFRQNSRGLISDSRICKNVGSGVLVMKGADATLRNNHFSNNGYAGIWLQKGATATIDHNEFRHQPHDIYRESGGDGRN